MKRLLKFSFMLAISCMSMIFASCDKFGTPSYSGDHPDSIYVAEAVEATVNPIFVSVGDAIDFQARMIEESNDEEVFMSLSPNVIANVTSVVIKNNGIARIRDIVHEYILHRDIMTICIQRILLHLLKLQIL